jgi:hypothetical protein
VRRDHAVDGGFEGIEVVLEDRPQDRDAGVLIGMPQPIAQILDTTPVDGRLERLPLRATSIAFLMWWSRSIASVDIRKRERGRVQR